MSLCSSWFFEVREEVHRGVQHSSSRLVRRREEERVRHRLQLHRQPNSDIFQLVGKKYQNWATCVNTAIKKHTHSEVRAQVQRGAVLFLQVGEGKKKRGIGRNTHTHAYSTHYLM